MTREETIKNQAEDYAEKHGFRVPYDGSNNFYDETDVKASLEGFIEGAKWADKKMIDKACEWLIENYTTNDGGELYVFVKDFRKAMEGGDE